MTVFQQLRVNIDGCGGLWSEPVELDADGKVVRIIEFKGHKATLLVRVKQLTGVQKQVIAGMFYNFLGYQWSP